MWLLYSATVLLSLQCLVIADDELPELVSRDDWDAISPLKVEYLPRPVPIVMIMHTVSTQCTTDEACDIRMQSLQNYHMEDVGDADIGSSFYVGSNGKIYEGVGWLHQGYHTPGFNDKSIGINFIGNYNTDVPTEQQINNLMKLVEYGVKKGHLTEDYCLVLHKQAYATQGPGRELSKAIKRLPRWCKDISAFKPKAA